MFSSRHAQPPPAYPAHYQNRIWTSGLIIRIYSPDDNYSRFVYIVGQLANSESDLRMGKIIWILFLLDLPHFGAECHDFACPIRQFVLKIYFPIMICARMWQLRVIPDLPNHIVERFGNMRILPLR
jgi:hypothetical protein